MDTYEKKYKDANNKVAARFGTNVAKEIFTDLYESEDERMMHQLHSWMKEFGGAEEYTEKVYTWLKSLLKKQGEHKRFRDSIQVGDNVTKNEYDELVNLSQLNRVAKRDADILKKQGEQKSTTIDVDKMVSDYASHNEKRNEIFGKPVPCMVRAYKQGICDTLESLGEEKPFEKEFTFKAIPRLLDMIEPSDRAKAYCQKLIDTLAKEEYNTDAKIVEGVLKGWNGEDVPMAVMDEKQGEQKPSTEVKPKFHEGDWIVDNIGVAHQIEKTVLNVTNNTFGYDIVGGGYFNDDSDVHLWTIQDAKDGDVLCAKYGNDEMPFIFTGKQGDVAYCALNSFGEFVLSIAEWLLKISVLPATKEQRDILFAKMKEAGYTFDFEKKELKKINKNTDVGHEYFSDLLEKDDCDNIDDYAYQCAYCMSHDWMKDTATWDDVERACKLGAEWNERHCKSIWGDGDVYNSKLILSTISQDRDLSLETKDKLTSWFKSLKPQNHWKPSDEQMEALGIATDIHSIPEKYYTELSKLYFDLKKLKRD